MHYFQRQTDEQRVTSICRYAYPQFRILLYSKLLLCRLRGNGSRAADHHNLHSALTRRCSTSQSHHPKHRHYYARIIDKTKKQKYFPNEHRDFRVYLH